MPNLLDNGSKCKNSEGLGVPNKNHSKSRT